MGDEREGLRRLTEACDLAEKFLAELHAADDPEELDFQIRLVSQHLLWAVAREQDQRQGAVYERERMEQLKQGLDDAREVARLEFLRGKRMTLRRVTELETYSRDALTILENAHYPPYAQEDSPDAFAVMDGLRAVLSTSKEETVGD